MIFGFIGTGNMGGALAKAAAKSLDPQQILLSNKTFSKAQALADQLKCRACSAEDVAREAELVFLGVKPHMMADLLAGLAPILSERKRPFCLVSMAAGLTMADIQRLAGAAYPVIRIMPNTPVSVGQGVILYDKTENVPQAMLEEFLWGMDQAGLLDPLPEKLIDAASAVAGCGPAFAALFMEALADGGVACGLPRAKAMEYAAKMLLGTATLALESGQHPGALKDAVCSPGGSTIAGVRALEQGAFRAAAMNAVEAAFHRTKELGK
jgi:pyrroline-5-carboxylate reductase